MIRRIRNAFLWSLGLSSAAYTGYRILATPFRPSNHRLALHLGRHLLEASGPCLAVTSRPMELERFAGGTLRRMVLAGIPVIMAVATPADAPAEGFEVQDDEALEAAHRIGYHRLQMLKVPAPFQTRHLEASLEELWGEVEPEVVVAFDPLDPLGWIDLPEERICGEAVLRLAEHLDQEHRVKLAFCGTRRPNALVEVTPILSDKIGAVLSHRTEIALPDLAVNLGLRLAGRLPDPRGSFEVLRVLEPARRSTDHRALARMQEERQEEATPTPGKPQARRAIVRTRVPVRTQASPEGASNYWASDGSVPERVGTPGDGTPEQAEH